MSQITESTHPLTWDLTDRLAKALKVGGVGKSEMADHLGVGRNTVTNYLYGRTNPTTGTLRLWALRCGVPFEWLRDGVEPGTGPDEPISAITLRYRADRMADVVAFPLAS